MARAVRRDDLRMSNSQRSAARLRACAAAGFAVINATGNLGGFVAQAAVPRIASATNDPFAPMLLLAVGLVVVAAGIFLIERRLPESAALKDAFEAGPPG